MYTSFYDNLRNNPPGAVATRATNYRDFGDPDTSIAASGNSYQDELGAVHGVRRGLLPSPLVVQTNSGGGGTDVATGNALAAKAATAYQPTETPEQHYNRMWEERHLDNQRKLHLAAANINRRNGNDFLADQNLAAAGAMTGQQYRAIDDANTRANQVTNAGVAEQNSVTNYNNALSRRTDLLAPAQASQIEAGAGATRTAASNAATLVPHEAGVLDATAEAYRQGNLPGTKAADPSAVARNLAAANRDNAMADAARQGKPTKAQKPQEQSNYWRLRLEQAKTDLQANPTDPVLQERVRSIQDQAARAERSRLLAPSPIASAGNVHRVTSDADFDALPTGAEFIDPNGVRRRKP